MAEKDPLLITRADIARLAEVQRPAVSNWERRHPDFPLPIGSGAGTEHFRVDEVLAWLESRKIPQNARSAEESAGTSYADRVRRNLRSCPCLPKRKESTEQESTEELVDELSGVALMELFRGVLSVRQYRDVLLTLLHLRGREPQEWAGLAHAARERNAFGDFHVALQAALADRVPGDLGPVTAIFGAIAMTPRQVEAVAAIVRLLDDFDSGPLTAMQPSRLTVAFGALLQRFAERVGGKAKAELSTPQSVTRLAAKLLTGTGSATAFYDPYCRSGELLAEVVATALHAGMDPGRIRADGAHPSALSSQIAKMNLALYGIEPDVRVGLATGRPVAWMNSYDLVVCNPPFNMRIGDQTVRPSSWRYGEPPSHNANFMWLQQAVSSLNDHGRAVVVMANNACWSANPREQKIRAAMVEDGIVACLVALPPQLFFGTAISATLWVLDKHRRHAGEILLIDATSMGEMASRTLRVLSDHDLSMVAEIFGRWWTEAPGGLADGQIAYRAQVAEIRTRDYSLHPAAYVSPLPATQSTKVQLRHAEALTAELQRLRSLSHDIDTKVATLLRDMGV